MFQPDEWLIVAEGLKVAAESFREAAKALPIQNTWGRQLFTDHANECARLAKTVDEHFCWGTQRAAKTTSSTRSPQ